jgi:hypothetical protein
VVNAGGRKQHGYRKAKALKARVDHWASNVCADAPDVEKVANF